MSQAVSRLFQQLPSRGFRSEALDAAAHMSRFSGTAARQAQDDLDRTWRGLQGGEEPLGSVLRRAEAQDRLPAAREEAQVGTWWVWWFGP